MMKPANPYIRTYATLLGRLILFLTVISLLIAQIVIGNKKGDWGVFHYYIGAKYVRELGYFDIYNCATRVETPNHAWDGSTLVRDLETYRIVPRDELPPCHRDRFTPARWQQFVHDITTMTSRWSPLFAREVVIDKGFNPPPTWAAFAGQIAEVVPLDTRIIALIAFHLDLIIILLVPVMIWWYVDGMTALLTLIISLGFFGTFGAIADGYLQYLWYPLLAASIIAWQRRRAALSGVMTGIAAALQVFPVVLAAPMIVLAIFSRKQQTLNDSRRFLLGMASTGVICAILATAYFGSMGVWTAWSRKIAIHKNFLQGEVFDVGLTNVIGLSLDPVKTDTKSYRSEYPASVRRAAIITQTKPMILTIAAVIILAALAAMITSPQPIPFVTGYVMLYSLLSLSPYYMLVITLIPLAAMAASPPVRKRLTYATITLIALHLIVYHGQNYVQFNFLPNLISEALIAIYSLLLIS